MYIEKNFWLKMDESEFSRIFLKSIIIVIYIYII